LKRELVWNAWRIIGKTTRTDVLADHLDSWFFNRTLLEEIDPQVRFILKAANLVTGVRFTMERDVIGDYSAGLAVTAGSGIRLAQAVAAARRGAPLRAAPWLAPLALAIDVRALRLHVWRSLRRARRQCASHRRRVWLRRSARRSPGTGARDGPQVATIGASTSALGASLMDAVFMEA
jgi:hypothetical protein